MSTIQTLWSCLLCDSDAKAWRWGAAQLLQLPAEAMLALPCACLSCVAPALKHSVCCRSA